MRQLAAGIFAKAGVPDADARLMGECLVDADLRGVVTHGCRFIPTYYKRLRQGMINPQPRITIVSESPGSVNFDADGSLGHVASVRAMRTCIEKAKVVGVAMATVRNSRHCGAMAYYAQMAADAGCIGNASTNGGVMMAPFGGKERAVGLNAVAWAVPTNRPWAVTLDMATSVVAGNKVNLAVERGEKIPLGWAIGPDGSPTDDPVQARQGALLPVGGAKGYGLAVVLDAMAGVLSGGRFGANQGLEPFAQKDGQFSHYFLAVAIDHFIPLEKFKERMGEVIEGIKATKPAEGSAGVFLPGEIEYNLRQRRLAEGIPYPVELIAEVEKTAAALGVA